MNHCVLEIFELRPFLFATRYFLLLLLSKPEEKLEAFLYFLLLFLYSFLHCVILYVLYMNNELHIVCSREDGAINEPYASTGNVDVIWTVVVCVLWRVPRIKASGVPMLPSEAYQESSVSRPTEKL